MSEHGGQAEGGVMLPEHRIAFAVPDPTKKGQFLAAVTTPSQPTDCGKESVHRRSVRRGSGLSQVLEITV